MAAREMEVAKFDMDRGMEMTMTQAHIDVQKRVFIKHANKRNGVSHLVSNNTQQRQGTSILL